jgi:hypothetical protein
MRGTVAGMTARFCTRISAPGYSVTEIAQNKCHLQQPFCGKEKSMRTIIVLCLLAVSAIIFPMSANAGNYICTVDQVGPTGAAVAGGARLWVTDTHATPAWTGSKAFKVPADRAKEFLAVGIAAIANDKRVRIITDTSMTNVTAVYLIKK